MSTQAIAYLRVSGKSQVEGDGFLRQQEAIDKLAMRQEFTIVKSFREEGVSGTTEWHQRPAFREMMVFLLDSHGVRTVFVENLTRLAREFTVQEGVLVFLASKGIDLISVDTGENVTQAFRADPMKRALIQMQAVFSELEKSNLVRKLRAARERKKAETGRCGGQHPYGAKTGEHRALAFMLNLRESGLTIRDVVKHLNATPEVRNATRNGRPWTAGVVARILARHVPPDADEPEFV